MTISQARSSAGDPGDRPLADALATAGPSPSIPSTPSASRLAGASLRRIYDFGLAGALGALIGLYLYVEMVRVDALTLRDALAGLLIGGAIGFTINAIEPFRDGSWIRLARNGCLGAGAGALGGLVGLVIGELVLNILQGGLIGRSLGWGLLGLGIGASLGLSDRSVQRLRFGLIGGGLGGLGGGFLFEALRMTMDNQPKLGQALGALVLGAGLGLGLALVEQVLRRAWVQVINGRQEGRIFLLTRDDSTIGLDEHVEIGLFGDLGVTRKHALIRRQANQFRLHPQDPQPRTEVNGVPVHDPQALGDGDRIRLGDTHLIFRQRGVGR